MVRERVRILVLILFFVYPLGVGSKEKDSRYEKLELFAKVLAHIEDGYIEEVNVDKLIYSAIAGMVSSLDVHSEFLEPEEYKLLREDTEGRFGGIGCEVRIEEDKVVVVSPLPESPALKAGLRPNDIILKIDGKEVRSKSIDKVVRMLRGVPGTKVKLLIKRVEEGGEKVFEVEIEREIIKVIPVQGRLIGDRIGYIKVRIFQEGTVRRFKEILELLKKESKVGLKGVIIDLRDNPGGLLKEAVDLADLFLEHGTIVITKGRGGKVISTEFATKGSINLPLVIIVNQNTASASEIFAGALKDYKKAILVGTPTFGKGTVQSLIEFRDGSALKLTVARYYTPLGYSIQAEGIQPDIYIEEIPQEVLETIRSKQVEVEKDLERHLESEGSRKSFGSPCQNINDIQLRVSCDLLDLKK